MSGLASYPAFCRFRSLKASVLTISVPPFGMSFEVRLQRRRVHGHEDVRLVAGSEDVVVGEVHLEPGDAGQGSGRRPDLGGEVREGREIVAHQGGLAREPVARQLHPVAGIAGEADDHTIELLDRLGAHWSLLRIVLGTGYRVRVGQGRIEHVPPDGTRRAVRAPAARPAFTPRRGGRP